ncbi:hypothetical protein CVT26_010299 [Gymnopilus dilepis]|uniref:UBC core domain-containing protein n=1 Tax=Gymnopilus dilepis TaxID=231916 RepID=A0A409Y0Y4_9AGAR|nr:hypothetical protein CVT26_010299 [Gymnopilus dilepis]
MSSQSSYRLLARLRKDLAELQDSPYPGVAVFTDDANFRKLCLILTPPSGPWKDLALHFDVDLPQEWPADPPIVTSSVRGIEHPNLFGRYICCDLLKPVGSGGYGYTGGYSPALTLRGLFLQFLTFFSSTKVEQDYGGHYDIGDEILTCYLPDSELGTRSHWPPSASKCSCLYSPIQQDEYQKIWESETTKETMLRTSTLDASGTIATDFVRYSHSLTQRLHKIVWPNFRRTDTINAISRWKCKRCHYGSPGNPYIRDSADIGQSHADPVVPNDLLQPPTACKLDLLSDDVLDYLASSLSSESIISLSTAYPRFHDVVSQLHILLRRELHCFFLRTPLNESILGIGVNFDKGARTLASDFDWLSMEAFDSYEVRKSIQKRDFNYFLPLAFNRPHFKRAWVDICKRLTILDAAVYRAEAAIAQKTRRPSNRRTGPPAKAYQSVEVLYRMMNNVVVSLMKSCDDMELTSGHSHGGVTLLLASEKAVISYCHLFHLLISLSGVTSLILQDATNKVRAFIDQPFTRNKNRTPDMGEFIVLITLVLVLPPLDPKNPLKWEDICGKFLEEAITRNVRWVLDASPMLEVMENGASDYRLETTFANSKTSLRLIMFQLSFFKMFSMTYASNLSLLDDNYGFAAKELPERMVTEIKEIYAVNTWPQFFQRVRFTKGLSFSKAVFCDMLRQTVAESARRRYHTAGNQDKMLRLRQERAVYEKKYSNAAQKK